MFFRKDVFTAPCQFEMNKLTKQHKLSIAFAIGLALIVAWWDRNMDFQRDFLLMLGLLIVFATALYQILYLDEELSKRFTSGKRKTDKD